MSRWIALLLFAALSGCGRQEAAAPAAAPAAGPAAAPGVDAHFLIPGDYAQDTSAAALQARFGKGNTRVVDVPERGLMLFPDDPARRAFVRFHDGEKLEELALIEVTEPASRWRGKHGVHVGMTLAKLRELNGKPFNGFSSLDGRSARVHDQWSVALDDDDGSLGRFDVEEDDQVYFDVVLGARDPAALPAPFPPDQPISSDDPLLAPHAEAIVVTGFGGATSLDDEW